MINYPYSLRELVRTRPLVYRMRVTIIRFAPGSLASRNDLLEETASGELEVEE